MEKHSGSASTIPSSAASIKGQPDLNAVATHQAIKALDNKAFYDRIIMIMAIATALIFFIEPLNGLWRGLFTVVKATGEAITDTTKTVDKVTNGIITDLKRSPAKGEKVSGYIVTSPYGMRNGRLHAGVDIGTPTGTPVYIPMDKKYETEVSCLFDSTTGGGLYAQFKNTQFPDYSFQAFHLTKCIVKPGETKTLKGGDIYGWTGGDPSDPNNGGTSTGAHLHWTEVYKGKRQPSSLFFAMWTIDGRPPNPTFSKNKPTEQNNEDQ
jgi:murein DD-endopeptidase MepM/ murein hydrolase activator NlpD